MIGEAGSTLSGGKTENFNSKGDIEDAPIVILDEATSSVDPENEKALFGRNF